MLATFELSSLAVAGFGCAFLDDGFGEAVSEYVIVGLRLVAQWQHMLFGGSGDGLELAGRGWKWGRNLLG